MRSMLMSEQRNKAMAGPMYGIVQERMRGVRDERGGPAEAREAGTEVSMRKLDERRGLAHLGHQGDL